MMQRLTVATFAGKSAAVVKTLLQSWRKDSPSAAVDRFALALRENGLTLPIVYYSEWVDRWSTGNLVPGPEALEGHRFHIASFSADQALAWAGQCGEQFPEQTWFSYRLREAAGVWGGAEPRTVVVLREVFDTSTTDDQVEDSLDAVPSWLSAF